MSRLSKYSIAPILLLMCMTMTCQSVIEADLVLINAKVWTVDRDHPTAEAVAMWNGRILAVGSDREIRPLIGPSTEVIDLEGKLVIPGFFDCHSHPVSGGFYRFSHHFGKLLHADFGFILKTFR